MKAKRNGKAIAIFAYLFCVLLAYGSVMLVILGITGVGDKWKKWSKDMSRII